MGMFNAIIDDNLLIQTVFKERLSRCRTSTRRMSARDWMR